MTLLMFGEVFFRAVNLLNWGCVGGLGMVGLLWCTKTLGFLDLIHFYLSLDLGQ